MWRKGNQRAFRAPVPFVTRTSLREGGKTVKASTKQAQDQNFLQKTVDMSNTSNTLLPTSSSSSSSSTVSAGITKKGSWLSNLSIYYDSGASGSMMLNPLKTATSAVTSNVVPSLMVDSSSATSLQAPPSSSVLDPSLLAPILPHADCKKRRKKRMENRILWQEFMFVLCILTLFILLCFHFMCHAIPIQEPIVPPTPDQLIPPPPPAPLPAIAPSVKSSVPA